MELRDRVYLLIKNHIQEEYEKSLCRPEVVRSLKMLCNVCSDKIDQKICFREFADDYLGKTLGYKLMRVLSKTPLFGKMFIQFIMEKVFFNYQFINCLIKCTEEVN
jgi:predicted nucleic acid-binding OB-fold protein